MIQKLDNCQLMEVYQDVLKMGIHGLKGLEFKHIIQVQEYAQKTFHSGIGDAVMLFEAYLNQPERISLNSIPEEYQGREVEYIGERHVKHYYESVFVLKVIKEYFDNEPKRLKEQSYLTENQVKNKEISSHITGKLSNPVKATFCLLIKNSGHYKKIGMSEFIINNQIVNREKYLKAICTRYNLDFAVRMAKAEWSEDDRPQYYQRIRELIYPKINQETIDSIESYINSKKPHY